MPKTPFSGKPKLFIPGPVDISAETYEAMHQPMVGHRSIDFANTYGNIQPSLQSVFGTSRPVFLSTSSAWGVMEGAIRNLVQKKALNLCCGAFSDKWHDVTLRCGKEAEKIQVPWGKHICPEAVRDKLAEGGFDTVTLVHNETSTGVMNPLAEIAAVVNEFPDTLLVVDAVSSLSAVPVDMDRLNLDVVLADTQKALALPPGMVVFAISEIALERAHNTPDRGFYFDFIEFEQNAAKNNTPTTPAISIIYALQQKMHAIQQEGLDNRFKRHAKLNDMIHNWVSKHDFKHFAEEGFRSKTLTAISNNKAIDIPNFIETLRKKHNVLINGGYGKLQGKTFRISNMGNETESTIAELIEMLDDVIVDFC